MRRWQNRDQTDVASRASANQELKMVLSLSDILESKARDHRVPE